MLAVISRFAELIGPEETPYAAGCFRLSLQLPANYPFAPPRAQFITRLMHPNIDSAGRICLDSLHLPPKGSWSPALSISTLLLQLRLLLAHPNARDGLVADITQLYINNRQEFVRQAAEATRRYAMPQNDSQSEIPTESSNDANSNASNTSNCQTNNSAAATSSDQASMSDTAALISPLRQPQSGVEAAQRIESSDASTLQTAPVDLSTSNRTIESPVSSSPNPEQQANKRRRTNESTALLLQLPPVSQDTVGTGLRSAASRQPAAAASDAPTGSPQCDSLRPRPVISDSEPDSDED